MVQQLLTALSALPQVEAIALGGSRAGTHFDEKSDYDIYVYTTAPVSEEVRARIFAPLCSAVEIGNHFWEYEDNGTFNDRIDFDLLWRDLDDFVSGVTQVAEHFQPSNCYTTCMWHNLVTCKILFDRTGRLTAAQQRFSIPYPEELKKAIVQRSLKLLRHSFPAFEAQIIKAAGRGDLFSINHRVTEFLASYFDLLFALNGKTHPGEKRLMQLCREQCAILPEDFEENLTSLFQDMFSAPQRLAGDIDRIIQAVEAVIPEVYRL